MGLNTDSLVKLSEETAHKLQSLWADIGDSPEEQNLSLKKLFDDVAAVYNTRLNNENSRKSSLENGITDKIKEIRTAYDELGEAAPALPERGDLTLLSWSATLEPIVEKSKERKHERLAQINELVDELSSLTVALGRVSDKERPQGHGSMSVRVVDELEEKISLLKKERTSKLQEVEALVNDIGDLWEELDIGPTDEPKDDYTAKIRAVAGKDLDEYSILGIAPSNFSQLEKIRANLLELRTERETKIATLAKEITALWDRVNVSDEDRQSFFGENVGLGPSIVAACEKELSRLQEIKREHLKREIVDEQTKLTILWDELQVDKTARASCSLARSTDYTDMTLESLKAETKKLDDKLKVLKPIMSAVNRRDEILKEEKELENIEADPSRLLSKQRGEVGRLLREEKLRNAVTKELPKLVKKLRELIPQYESESGQLFMVSGNRFLDALDEEETTRDQKKKEEAERKKESRAKRQQAQRAEDLAQSTPLKTPKGQTATKGRTPASVGRPSTAPPSTERPPKSATKGRETLSNIPVNRC